MTVYSVWNSYLTLMLTVTKLYYNLPPRRTILAHLILSHYWFLFLNLCGNKSHKMGSICANFSGVYIIFQIFIRLTGATKCLYCHYVNTYLVINYFSLEMKYNALSTTILCITSAISVIFISVISWYRYLLDQFFVILT